MENSDIGEHEDADVKSERQKVFVSPALGQEPPLVLLQVSKVVEIKLSFNVISTVKQIAKFVNEKLC